MFFLKTKYWKNKVSWSDGYFSCSIVQVSKDIIEKYIQNQG
ncbi:transposase [Holdemanella porci]